MNHTIQTRRRCRTIGSVLLGAFLAFSCYEPGQEVSRHVLGASTGWARIAVDEAGNLLVADGTSTRKLDAERNAIWSVAWGRDVAFDAQGDALIVDTFTGSIDVGAFHLTSTGDSDIFVAKLGPSGTVLWAVALGDMGPQAMPELGVDADGNALVLDPGLGVVKLTPNGSIAWAFNTSTETGESPFQRVTVGPTGEVVVGGSFQGSFEFADQTHSSTGFSDIFIGKLSAEGLPVWGQTFGGAGQAELHDVAVDLDGNMVACGQFSGTLDFGGALLEHHPSDEGPSKSAWCTKLAPFGEHIWSGADNDTIMRVFDIATDADGNILVSGQKDLPASHHRFVSLFKLGPAGQMLWHKLATNGEESGPNLGTDLGTGLGVTTDASLSVYWAAATHPSWDPNSFEKDLYVVKYAP